MSALTGMAHRLNRHKRIGGMQLGAVVLGAAGLTALASSAEAKECTTIPVTAASQPSASRVVAYPASLLAWRQAARESAGAGFENWSSAADRTADCKQITISAGGQRWVCTRKARPCKGFGSETVAGKPAGTGGSGSAGTAGGGTAAGGASGGTCSLPFPKGRKSFRPGDKGAEVTKIQEALAAKGAKLNKGADGNFGSGTAEAVRSFQRKEKITPADGWVGNKTCVKLGL